jgi:hypothetical protein
MLLLRMRTDSRSSIREVLVQGGSNKKEKVLWLFEAVGRSPFWEIRCYHRKQSQRRVYLVQPLLRESRALSARRTSSRKGY